MKLVDLSQTKAEKEQAHADKVLSLFRDHPELAKDAVIISPPGPDSPGICLAPEHFSSTEVEGILESAKIHVVLGGK